VTLGLGAQFGQSQARPDSAVRDPDAVCAPCHREIYQKYRKTPMANASGIAADGFVPGDFTHAASGVHYRVTNDGGRVWLSYERASTSPDRSLNGRQELQYFIGSGKRGRTYLFERSGYWFESPINWYSRKKIWDMAPNLLSVREMPLTLPIDPGCLHCHASNVARSLPEARNLYSGEPFAQGGISCEACHGESRAHVASSGKVQMLDIDALQPVRRDSICLNCHLEGREEIIRQGKRLEDFVPGDNLFDFAAYFVYKTEMGSGGRATSQWEALLRSQCKKKSGDRLTCTTCHDPHGSPSPESAVAFYRQKCLSCHGQERFAERHHPENKDCTSCHMARPTTNDIAHEQVTDHWIRKRVSNEPGPKIEGGELESVESAPGDDRDLGLAYAELAVQGDRSAGERALTLLKRAEHEGEQTRSDHELHADLGFLEQMNGEQTAASEEYQMALHADPYDWLAAGDLAIIDAKNHRYSDAMQLWEHVFEHNPAQLEAGMNLATVECGLGETKTAEETLERLLEFSPDDQRAKDLLIEIRSKPQNCASR
jgi:predicted CXXCH cytochrome family protein